MNVVYASQLDSQGGQHTQGTRLRCWSSACVLPGLRTVQELLEHCRLSTTTIFRHLLMVAGGATTSRLDSLFEQVV